MNAANGQSKSIIQSTTAMRCFAYRMKIFSTAGRDTIMAKYGLATDPTYLVGPVKPEDAT